MGATPAFTKEAEPPPESREPEELEEEEEPPPPPIVTFDLRSLALFRIAFGMVVLIDLLCRVPEINDFYTDTGVLPRSFMFAANGAQGAYSLQYISGQWIVQFAIFAVMIAVMLSFIAGYRMRLASTLAWLLVMSMQGRNPFVLHGGDDVIRILLFWSIFAPLNGRWSVDAVLHPEQRPLPVLNASWGAQALMFQLCFIYWSTAVWKWHPVWHTEGSAIYYALSLEQFAKPFGHWLLQFPTLLKFMTFGTLSLEFFGPFLLFVPFYTRWFRLLAMLSFIGLHMGIFLTMAIGPFPWACMAAWLMIMPTMVWEQLERLWAHLSLSARASMARARTWTVAAVRYTLARFRVPPAPKAELGPVASVFVVAYALNIFAINFLTLPQVAARVNPYMAFAEVVLGLHQRWAMFAPYPMTKDGWYQVLGTKPDGSKIDIWNGGIAPTANVNVLDSYRDVRWNKYLNLITYDGNNAFRPHFGNYLCRSWNTQHGPDSRVGHISINFMTRITPPPGKPMPPEKLEQMWQQDCAEQGST